MPRLDINQASWPELRRVFDGDKAMASAITDARKKAPITKQGFLKLLPEMKHLADQFIYASEIPKVASQSPGGSVVTTARSRGASAKDSPTTAATPTTSSATVSPQASIATATTVTATAATKSTATTIPTATAPSTTAKTSQATGGTSTATTTAAVASTRSTTSSTAGASQASKAIQDLFNEFDQRLTDFKASVLQAISEVSFKTEIEVKSAVGDLTLLRDNVNTVVRPAVGRIEKRLNDFEVSLAHTGGSLKGEYQNFSGEVRSKVEEVQSQFEKHRTGMEKAYSHTATTLSSFEERLDSYESDLAKTKTRLTSFESADSTAKVSHQQFAEMATPSKDVYTGQDARRETDHENGYARGNGLPRGYGRNQDSHRDNYDRGPGGRGSTGRDWTDQNFPAKDSARGYDRHNDPLPALGSSTPMGGARFNGNNTQRSSFTEGTDMASKPRLPKYHGDGIWKVFISQFMVHAEENHWTEAKRKKMLLLSLRDSAADYFTMVDMPNRTFMDMVQKMEKRFGKKELPETLRVQFAGLKQDAEEDLFEWAERVQKVANDAFQDLQLDDRYITEEIVRRFCQGATDKDLACHATSMKPQTLEEAIDIMRMREFNTKAIYGGKKTSTQVRQLAVDSSSESDAAEPAQVRRFQRSQRRSERKPFDSTPIEKRVNKLEDSVKSLHDNLGGKMENIIGILQGRATSKDSGSRDRSSRQDRQVSSHARNRSSSADSRPGSRDRGGTCFGCGKEGHWRRDCPEKEKDKRGDKAVNFSLTKDSLNSSKGRESGSS